MLINDWGDMSEAQEPTLDREFLSSLKDIKVSATTCMFSRSGSQLSTMRVTRRIVLTLLTKRSTILAVVKIKFGGF